MGDMDKEIKEIQEKNVKILREQLEKVLVNKDSTAWDVKKIIDWINRLVDKERLNFSIHVLKYHPSTTLKKEEAKLTENVKEIKPAGYYLKSDINGIVRKLSIYLEKLKEPEDAYRIKCPECEGEALIYLKHEKKSDSAIGVCIKCKNAWVAEGIKGITTIMKKE